MFSMNEYEYSSEDDKTRFITVVNGKSVSSMIFKLLSMLLVLEKRHFIKMIL